MSPRLHALTCDLDDDCSCGAGENLDERQSETVLADRAFLAELRACDDPRTLVRRIRGDLPAWRVEAIRRRIQAIARDRRG